MLWLILFSACFVVQMAYWAMLWHGFTKAYRLKSPPLDAPLLPVSVIVAARNEADNLPALLTALTQQTHLDFEIVLVDDASTDATPGIAHSWQQTHPALRVLRIKNPVEPRKKHALTEGIAAARHDLLAFTDADCTPPPDWLATLAAQHAATDSKALLVGYGPFRKAPGLLNGMARYETFVTGVLTAAAIGLDRPYMAVGRNLSYTRSLFQKIDGFDHALDSLSGDDDLLVQEVARHRAAPIYHVFAPESFVPSNAPTTWKQWIRQKRRHLSAGQFYDRGILARLTVFHATSVVLWLAPLALGWTGVVLLAGKLIAQGFVLRHAAHVLHERDLLPAFPLLELGYTAYTLLMAPLGLARLPKRW